VTFTRLCSIMIIVASIAGLSHAELYVYEPFDYTAGQDLNAELGPGNGTLNGGNGWAGAWVTEHDQDDDFFEVQSGGLSFATLPVAGNSAGRTAARSGNRGIAYRTNSASAQALLTADNSTIWFSVLYDDAGPGDDFAFIFGDTRHTFGSGDPVLLAAGNAFGFAAVDSAIYAIKHENSTAQALSSGSLAANGSVFLLVGKINWKSDGTPDELFLFNIADDTDPEPAEGSAFASQTADLDQSAFNVASMWDRPATPGTIDEMRFASTYEVVVGKDPPPPSGTVIIIR
jgi:hypothetical protein